jgi:cysteinyl-tRNA synthetase
MIDDGREVEAGPVVQAVREMLDVLGLVADEDDGDDEADDAEIDALMRERDDARAARDFARADAIRDDLTARGVKLEDTPSGTVWHR